MGIIVGSRGEVQGRQETK